MQSCSHPALEDFLDGHQRLGFLFSGSSPKCLIDVRLAQNPLVPSDEKQACADGNSDLG